MAPQKKKVTLYFNAAMLAETQKEALRQDRSVSWIIQAAWRLARDEIRRMPGRAGGRRGQTGRVEPHTAALGRTLRSVPTRPALNILALRAVRNVGERVR